MSSSNECFENYYYGKNLKYSFLRQLLSTQIIFCEKKKFRGVNNIFIATQKIYYIFLYKKNLCRSSA